MQRYLCERMRYKTSDHVIIIMRPCDVVIIRLSRLVSEAATIKGHFNWRVVLIVINYRLVCLRVLVTLRL